MFMKKTLIFLMALLAGICSASAKLQQDVIISTRNTSLLLLARRGEPLKIAYYGQRLADEEASQVWQLGLSANRQAYPSFNSWPPEEYAIEVEHADGSISLDLVYDHMTRQATADGEIVKFFTRDKVYPFEVVVCYRTHAESDVIETWTEISHAEKKGDVKLSRFDSAYLPIRGGQVWLSHLHGGWGNECNLYEQPLTAGMMTIKNRDGARNTHTSHPEIMLSLDGQPREDSGRVIGAALCYSGNFRIRIDTDIEGKHLHHLFAGIDPSASEYHLKAGETFTTPQLALTYSPEGKGGVSRNFHKWARKTRIHHGEQVRDVLLNSWEGVYMNVNNDNMAQMMKEAAEIGGELFVMDDGWFGSKDFRRVDDTQALGDWNVDSKKLPGGITRLIADAKANHIKFGIWIEPEYGNWQRSEVWQKHPDWFLQNKGRDPKLGRGGSQALLDLCNPKVQDFVFGIVDNLMSSYPDIAYIKWDANCSLLNYGSAYLPKDRQSHIYIDYHKGLENTLQRIRAKYPDLVIQACASGGGRVNYGLLPYFDEVWTSDNTEAYQRVFIQWGTSMFYPSNVMGAHVSASPNHQSGRVIPLKFRFDVAMTGRLGLEMKPSDFTPEEKAFARQAIADYKRLRPVIQLGDLYRLISPYEGNRDAASLMYVAPDKSKAVFFGYKMKHMVNQAVTRFKMAGLNPHKNYRIHEINATDDRMKGLEGAVISGQLLMSAGLELSLPSEYSSRVFELTALD